MKLLNKNKSQLRMWVVFLAIALSSCLPEKIEKGTGLNTNSLTVSFTMTPMPDKINKFLLQADASKALGVKWDKGDGSYFLGYPIDTLFLPDIGDYTIGLSVIGRGGQEVQSTQNVSITTADPVAGNLVL